MSRSTRLALWCIGLFLFSSVVIAPKPGLPPNLKSDEPAYFLMARSLVEDGDLRCEPRDLRRLFEEFEFEAHNLIVMSDDGFRTVYFGKPYIYSLLAAPMVALFGSSGLVGFNMLLLIALIVMGTSYLSRFNASGYALAFSLAYFTLTNAYAYVYWIHPELLMMTAIAACLYLVLHQPEGAYRRWLRALGSGAVLAFAVYNKPMYAALGLVPLFALVRRRHFAAVAIWITGAVLMSGAIAGGSVLLTGHPTAYLGVARQGFTVHQPYGFPFAPIELQAVAEQSGGGDWGWFLRPPEPGAEWMLNVKYFFVGRHTGLVGYGPFAVLAVLLFVVHRREKWVGLYALIAMQLTIAAVFLTMIDFNWHGGGGFVGNRYFVAVYPSFLFLISSLRPLWLTPVLCGIASMLVGVIPLAPYGPIVPRPTLQATARNFPLRLLPFDLTLKDKMPGYKGVAHTWAWIEGRQDRFLKPDQSDEIWIAGAASADLRITSVVPLSTLVFDVRSFSSDNRIELTMGKAKAGLNYHEASFERPETQRITLRPEKPWTVWTEYGQGTRYVYLLTVKSRNGANPRWSRADMDDFYTGAALVFHGTEEQANADVYHAKMETLDPPASVTAGAKFSFAVQVSNLSSVAWPLHGVGRVNLAYHWLDQDGKVVIADGRRSSIGRSGLDPGLTATIAATFEAPSEPGKYLLELDCVYELHAWFADRGSPTIRVPIEVIAR